MLLDAVSQPDFAQLSKEYPGVAQYYVDGHYKFEELEASYELADALLRKYFNLHVNLPREHLCPRIPNRLDYILWVRELVESSCDGGEIRGLDVGVGATCIYPLLGCSVTDWSFVGTDINDQSLKYCRQNIDQNQLGHRIKIQKAGLKMFDLEGLGVEDLDFTMCNPPFYDTAQDLENSRRGKELKPSTAKLVAQDSELYTTGGEEGMTLQMVRESIKVRTKISWFTTMVGKKTTVERLIKELKAEGINNYAIHDIVHGGGKTRRWTVAWSFGDRRLRDSVARAHSHAIRHLNPSSNEFPLKSDPLTIFNILKDLPVRMTKTTATIVECNGDVWSRAYRRKASRGEANEMKDKYEFEITSDNVRWVQGKDPKVFESFCGLLQRSCREGSDSPNPKRRSIMMTDDDV